MYKKLFKSRYDTKIDGVCAGMAYYLNMDPVVMRLIWVVGAFFTAVIPALILYFICSAIIPREPECF